MLLVDLGRVQGAAEGGEANMKTWPLQTCRALPWPEALPGQNKIEQGQAQEFKHLPQLRQARRKGESSDIMKSILSPLL